MIIYVVMCDTPRTDLDNVNSAFFDKQKAIDRMELLNIEDTWNTWHIEKLDIEDSKYEVFDNETIAKLCGLDGE